METKFLALSLLSFVAVGLACRAQNPATSGNSHANLNQNAKNMPTANQAAMNHQDMNHGEINHSAMQSSSNAASAPYDLQFLDTMIAHHQGAVDTAKFRRR